MDELFNYLFTCSSFIDLENYLQDNAGWYELAGVSNSGKAYVIAGLKQKFPKLLIMSSYSHSGEELFQDIISYWEKEAPFYYLEEELIESQYPQSSVLTAFDKLFHSEEGGFLTTSEVLTTKVVSPKWWLTKTLHLEINQEINLSKLAKDLVEIGYTRVWQVEKNGEFSIRGGIIDVFPANDDSPYRIELEGDLADKIRTFDCLTQRSIEEKKQIRIFPWRSVVAGEDEESCFIKDYFSSNAMFIINDFARVKRNYPPDYFDGKKVLNFTDADAPNSLELEAIPAGRGSLQLLTEDLARYPYGVVMLTRQPLRLEHLLAEENFAIVQNQKPAKGQVKILHGKLRRGFIFKEQGIAVYTDREIFGRNTSYRSSHYFKEGKGHAVFFEDLKEGDFVVHIQHGISKFLGLERIEIEGIKRDFIHLQFAGTDKIYLPVEQMDLVQKYIGLDGRPPSLSKLGSREWKNCKRKVKEEVDRIAEELLKLYAARENITGYKFSPDTPWQGELEDSFIYEETPDQLTSIKEVKQDMENNKPMDRLLCGDVGYGKTEVAMRAAFKAVMDSKQVAILSPTTVLAQQHYHTFKERLALYPVEVEMLSRFKTKAEQKKIIKKLQDGKIDLIIGTHRLLQKDVEFNRLGLIIVDEEQRFGVMDKEKLKNMRLETDILTLTATPIPRTLHMSLVGIRDLSIIDTPPPDRLPIRSFVLPFDDRVVFRAINRELERGGQVYFVNDRVENIEAHAVYLQKLLPDAKVIVAHGQMPINLLEDAMLDFQQRKANILLCTTIIENGLDIPNVNTIIINNADKFGLAQLYQLRGRVGRSSRQAYAYFLYHRQKKLTSKAQERLDALVEFSQLGSGYRLAMRDLEIRGAGSLLGTQQHGNIASVGFELYCQMLAKAVKERKEAGSKKDDWEDTPTPLIQLSVDAYLPDSYIPSSAEKLRLYKRIACFTKEEELEEIKIEFQDRFGDLPEEVSNLLKIVKIKIAAKKSSVWKINSDNEFNILIDYPENFELTAELIQELFQTTPCQLSFLTKQLGMNVKTSAEKEWLEELYLVINTLGKRNN